MSRFWKSFNQDTEDLGDIACGKVRKTLLAYCSGDKCCEYYKDFFNKKKQKMMTIRQRKTSVPKHGLHKSVTICPDCRQTLKWELE